MGQTIGEVAMRRRSSADARPTSAFRDAGLAKNLCRSEARWREEVMPGGSSGEVRPTASGSDAGAYAPGGKIEPVC